MIVIVAPEPAAWLEAVLAAARAASDPVTVLAPWALAAPIAGVADRLPGPMRRFVARRRGPTEAETALLWPVGQALVRIWVRGRVDRRYRAMFAERAAVDHWAAGRLARLANVRWVIAPSCAALATFAAARALGAATLLVEDLPDLRTLHHDLDRAAAVHAQSAFLRRYRAPVSAVQRQESERICAGALAVRGSWARDHRVAAGRPPDEILALPELGAQASGARPTAATGRVLLAGLAAARMGVHEALAALAARPQLTLIARAGEGADAGVFDRPRVAAATAADLALDGIAAVIAPAWCESYPREVGLAAARGVPVIATRAAAGFVDLGRAGAEIAPGDIAALGHALDRVLAGAARSPVADAARATAHHALVARLRRDAPADAPAARTRLRVITD